MTDESRASEDDEPLRVLLVEDDEKVAQALMASLAIEAEGLLSIKRVGGLAEALHKLKDTQFDWVFLDPGLPDADGADAINAICDASAGALVVLITGGLKDSAAEQAATRTQGLVLKPLPPRAALIKSLLEEPLAALRPDAIARALQSVSRARRAVQAWKLNKTDAGTPRA